MKMLLTRRVLVATLASAPAARRSTEHTCKVIDSAVHVWSNGQPPYPWAVAPPEELTATATYEALTASTQAAGVAGALIVQPANHMFDHSYVTAALRAHPDLYRGMLLANPTLAPAAAAAELERLHADGFVGVRFNPYLFPDGMDSPVGHALYKKAGELQMPVGVMCFKGLLPQLPALTALLDASPETTLIVDHLGFFRQPATGGLQGGGAANDEAAWKALLALAARPQACKSTPSPSLTLTGGCYRLWALWRVSQLVILPAGARQGVGALPRLRRAASAQGPAAARAAAPRELRRSAAHVGFGLSICAAGRAGAQWLRAQLRAGELRA